MCSNLHVPDEAEQTALRPFPNQRSPTNDLLPSILLRFLTGRWTAKHFSITARITDTVYIQNSPGEIYTRRVFFKRNLWKTPSTRVRSQKPSPFSGCGAYGIAQPQFRYQFLPNQYPLARRIAPAICPPPTQTQISLPHAPLNLLLKSLLAMPNTI
jgi:hypothetical protein